MRGQGIRFRVLCGTLKRGKLAVMVLCRDDVPSVNVDDIEERNIVELVGDTAAATKRRMVANSIYMRFKPIVVGSRSENVCTLR